MAVACHCRSCQAATGSAFALASALDAHFAPDQVVALSRRYSNLSECVVHANSREKGFLEPPSIGTESRGFLNIEYCAAFPALIFTSAAGMRDGRRGPAGTVPGARGHTGAAPLRCLRRSHLRCPPRCDEPDNILRQGVVSIAKSGITAPRQMHVRVQMLHAWSHHDPTPWLVLV